MTPRRVRRRLPCPHCVTHADYLVRALGTVLVKCKCCHHPFYVSPSGPGWRTTRKPPGKENMSTPETVDALDVATKELAANMVPTPSDIIDGLSPLAMVWYLREMGYAVVTNYTGMLADPDVASDVKDGDDPVQALNAVAEAVGLLDGACMTLKLLDDAFRA